MMRKVSCFLFPLLLVVNLVLSQVAEQDSFTLYLNSLKREVLTAPKDSLPNLLLEITELSTMQSADTALAIAMEGLKVSRELESLSWEAKFLDMIGRIRYLQEKYLLAGRMFESALEKAIASNDIALISHAANSQGLYYLKIRDYSQARKSLSQSIEGFEKTKQYNLLSNVYLNMSFLHSKENQIDLALINLNKSLEIAKMIGWQEQEARLINNKGELYQQIKDYDKAESLFLESLKLKEALDNPQLKITTLQNLSLMALEQHKYQDAEQFLNEAFIIASAYAAPRDLLTVYSHLAVLQDSLGNFQQSENYYLLCLELSEGQYLISRSIEVRQKLAALYVRMGETGKSLNQQQQVSTLLEQQLNKITAQSLEEVAGINEFNHEERNFLQMKEQKSRHNMELLALFGMLVLAILLLLALYSRYLINKKVQVKLQAVNEEINFTNSLLEQKNKEIELKNDKLKQSNSDLAEFAYAASHDLREPLRTITSYLQLFKRRFGSKIEDSGIEFLRYAEDGAIRMDHLLQALLDYSRVGRYEREKLNIDLNRIIEEVVLDLRKSISDSGAVLKIDNLAVVPGYATELYQLLLNIVSNAIKFRNDQPLVIHISTCATAYEVLIKVQDNGIGIEPDKTDKIFGMFQRLHGPGVYPGTGIGLAICNKVVDHHGGRIWVESVLGQGTTFFISLPLTRNIPVADDTHSPKEEINGNSLVNNDA